MLVAPALAVATLLLGAPAAAPETHADTVGDMVEQLRSDPVLVQPSMGMGDSELAHDVLTEAADSLDQPVYVVLADTPADLAATNRPAEQAAALFRAELGDGLYVIEFTDDISYTRSWGGGELDEARSAPVYTAIEKAEADATGEYPRASALFEAVLTLRWAAQPAEPIPDAVVDEYAAQPWAFIPDSDYGRVDATAGRWVALLATVTAVVVAGTIITLVVARSKPLPRRRGRTGYAPVPDDIAATARRRLDDARRRLAELPAAQVSGARGEAAATALEAGDQVLATGDPLDAVGASVLAAVADRELERVTTPKRRPYVPCFVNPLHGEARDTVRLDGSSLDAPVCRDCARSPGPFLAVRRRLRGWAPYAETPTVWARTGYGALVGDLAAQVLEDRGARR